MCYDVIINWVIISWVTTILYFVNINVQNLDIIQYAYGILHVLRRSVHCLGLRIYIK